MYIYNKLQCNLVTSFLAYLLSILSYENCYHLVAGVTGLEPAASCVTGRRSNQLSYTPHFWWAVKDSNLWPPRCKRDALPTELTAPKYWVVLYQHGYNVNYNNVLVSKYFLSIILFFGFWKILNFNPLNFF